MKKKLALIGAVALTVLAAIYFGSRTFTPTSKSGAFGNVQYKVFSIDTPAELESQLNKYAADGWRLSGTVPPFYFILEK